jgi:serine protease Do
VAVVSVGTMGLRGRVLPAVVCAATLVAVSACGGGASSTSSSTHSAAVHRVTATHTSTSTSSTDVLAALVAKTRSGVIRIEANGCGTQDIGTGFLIGPRLVATVEHVVAGATSISLVRDGKTLAAGTVIGDDPVRDVALVQADARLSGYVFQFASAAPALGDSVAALGFPLGLPLSVSQGSVSGTGRTIPIDGVNRRELIQTDAAVNPGNSGGPLLSLDSGRVDGLIDLGTTQANGIAFAVSAQVAKPLIEAWEAAPQTGPAQTCQSVTSTATSSASSTASSTATSVAPGPAGAVDALDSY